LFAGQGSYQGVRKEKTRRKKCIVYGEAYPADLSSGEAETGREVRI